jgi:hypothetical protein
MLLLIKIFSPVPKIPLAVINAKYECALYKLHTYIYKIYIFGL